MLTLMMLVFVTPHSAKPLVSSGTQIKLVVATSTVLGAAFGFIFGLLDVEDARLSHLSMQLQVRLCRNVVSR
jgi:hypothetical protein